MHAKSGVQASWEQGKEVLGGIIDVIYGAFWCNFELKWGLCCNSGKGFINLYVSL
jgi:hypothetical protein